MPAPNIYIGHVAGDTLPAADWDANFALAETSVGDLGGFVIAGLVPSAGSGLSVSVTSGNALIGADVVFSAGFNITGLVDGILNHLFVLQNGTGTSNTSGTPPAMSAKIGTATTSGGVVTAIHDGLLSGRQQWQAPYALIPGGPASGITSAGHLASINLALWAASAGEGVPVYGTLPAGAIVSGPQPAALAALAVTDGATQAYLFGAASGVAPNVVAPGTNDMQVDAAIIRSVTCAPGGEGMLSHGAASGSGPTFGHLVATRPAWTTGTHTTIEVVMRRYPTIGSSKVLVEMNSDSTNTQYSIETDGSGNIGVRFGASLQVFASRLDQDWFHLIGVWDGSNVQIYHNGLQMVNVTQTVNQLDTTNPQINVFGTKGTNADNLAGAIAFLAIYQGTALSETQAIHHAATFGLT